MVGATVIANLTTHRDTIETLWHDAQEERRESSQAYAAKRELFDKQSSLMTFVFGAAKLVWGNDDPRLRDLGLVPKSEIWTSGMPVPGEPEPPENWDDPPTGLTLKEGPPGFANISATLHEDADGAGIYLVEGPLGVSAQPVMSPKPAEPKVPLPYGMPINDKVRSWIWVCAVKDGVLG